MSGRGRGPRGALLAALLALMAAACAAQDAPPEGERIVVGLSAEEVAITTTFDGSSILIFGAVRRDAAPSPRAARLEVAVAVSGPLRPLVVRRAERVGGIWVNAGAAEVDAAPSFYAVATTGPFDEVLSDTEDLRHAVSIRRAVRAVGTGVEDRQDYLNALLRIRGREGVWRVVEGGVTLAEDSLFQTSIDLPANLTEGDYRVRIFLARGGQVVDSHEAVIAVRKVGLERWLHALSVGQPVLYGIMALGLAIGAGWAAQAAFGQTRT